MAKSLARRGGRRVGRCVLSLLEHDLMPFTYSITNGIGAGFITFVFIKLARGRSSEVHPMMFVAAAAFLVYFGLFYVEDRLT